MRRAVEMLSVTPELLLIDGNRTPSGLTVPSRTLVKGDALSASVGAASILAKVSRDRLLMELDKEYPQYAFAKHKGYGTALHYEKLAEYGMCPAHRPSFLKKLH
jgi:ribonuclease HII